MKTKKLFIVFLSLASLLTFIAVKNLSAEDSHISNILIERSLGSDTAPNELIEYASMSCPHCATFHNEEMPQIIKEYIETGKVKYIFRDFPLDRAAMLGSMIAQCQSKERYFPILNTLFRQQEKWIFSEEIPSSIHKILKQYGLTLDEIENCLKETEENKARWEQILETRLKGQQMGVDATPMFFVNGKKVVGKFNSEKLKTLIE
tara:strand:- start:896 stop:1510 length:615 start_codon:yes stop_codon:yes gene_type:complete